MRVVMMLALFGACGGDTKSIDAAVAHDATHVVDAITIDGRPATVVAVDCATVTPSASVMTMNFAFVPMAVTIAAGQTVKFTTESEHDIIPDPAATATDPGLRVDFGSTTCLKFTATGTFGYKCAPHGFKGAVTVN